MARKDLQNLKKRLDTLQSFKSANADPEWKYTFRQSLLIKVKTQSMAKIYEQKIAQDLGFFGFIKNWQPKPAMMPASIFSGVLFIFFGLSFGTVWASRGSLPGDVLFPVKLAVERTQLATKNEPVEKTRFQVEITNRRAEEIVRLATTGQEFGDRKSEKIEQAVSELRYQLDVVEADLSKMQKGNNLENTTKTAKEVSAKLSLVQASLKQAKEGLASTDEKLAQKIETASELVDMTSTQALTVLAQSLSQEQSEQGDLDKQDIVEKIETKISQTEEKIKQISEKVNEGDQTANSGLAKEQAQKAQEILEEAKESLKNEKILVALETVKVAKEIVIGASNIASGVDSSQATEPEQEKPASNQEEPNQSDQPDGDEPKEDAGQKEPEGSGSEPQPVLEGNVQPEETPSASLQLTKS